jgi:CelD/BcsL family acetyltransferase involved in cellulose biosynthesis
MINQVDLENIKQEWEQIRSNNTFNVLFLTSTWHETWNTVFGKDYTPFYLLVNNEIIAPFVKHGDEIIFSGGEEISDYSDLIGPDEKKAAAWGEIIPYCKNEHVASISLRNVPQNSPTLSFFQQLPGAVIKQEDTTPTMPLPTTWETFIEGIPDRKYRHELERKIRKFERENPEAKIVTSHNPKDDMAIFLSLMEKDADKNIFLTDDMKLMFQQLANAFHETISLLFLEINGVKIASTLSFVQNHTYYLYNSGFDKENYPNAGFYLKAMSVKHAIETGCTTYNFLQGNERYKYELGGKDFFVYSIKYTL